MAWKLAVSIFALVLIAGCGGDGRQAAEPLQQGEGAVPPPPPPPPAPSTEDPAPETVRKPATVGVGKKGRGYGGGPISTPIAAYFSTRQRIVFDIEIPPAMNAYRALNGHFPKSHEVFMEEIIKANSIRLPELPSGERYVYDAEKAKTMNTYDPRDPPLMVEREGTQTSPR